MFIRTIINSCTSTSEIDIRFKTAVIVEVEIVQLFFSTQKTYFYGIITKIKKYTKLKRLKTTSEEEG